MTAFGGKPNRVTRVLDRTSERLAGEGGLGGGLSVIEQ